MKMPSYLAAGVLSAALCLPLSAFDIVAGGRATEDAPF